MCGIAGYFSFQSVDEVTIQKMGKSLAHRGPDAEQFHIEFPIAFAHRRLSIIDLSSDANQPMISQNGKWLMMFNGEVFNYREIATGLNIQLHTNSDTEVMLEAFSKWGLDAVHKFNGMFVIALYHREEKVLYLIRDRIGVKPLYYYRNGNEIFFASEICALTCIDQIKSKLTIDQQAVSFYLQLGYVPEPNTIWNEIKKFPSGQILKTDLKHFEFHSYWNSNEKIKEEVISNAGFAKKQLNELLNSSVQYRMISDVPYGIFLSGGIDSSLIASIAQKNSSNTLETFSIGFTEQQYNEAPFAKAIAKKLGTNHHELIVTENDAMKLVEESIDMFGEPFADSSAIPTMMVSKLARSNAKMVLSGDGGDELFMGYGMYSWAERLNNPLIKVLSKPAAEILSLMSNKYKRVSTLFRSPGRVSLEQHIFSQEQYFFSDSEVKTLLKSSNESGRVEIQSSAVRKLSAAEKQSFFDLNYYLKDDLLVKVDRATMHYSLECRTPFLDYRIVEFALNVSQDLKMKNGVLKILLKELLKDYLPHELFDRPKKGFAVPLKLWLKEDLKYLVDQYLSEESVTKYNLVHYSVVQELKRKFYSGNEFLYNRLWNLIVLHRWLSKNIIH